MKVHDRCKTCLLEQSARTFFIVGLDDKARKDALKYMEDFINERFTPERITAELGTEVHKELKRITGKDPYDIEKKRSNKAALALVPYARALIERSDDHLFQSFKIAIAGNLIDFGTYDFDVEEKASEIRDALMDEFEIDASEKLKEQIKNSKKILYLCDNAGEIVFDKLCIEEIQKLGPVVTAAVKSGPIVNDATMEDAKVAGLDGVCRVIETGTDSVGVNLEEASMEFKEELTSTDLIIAKGQGHFETMDDMKLPIAYLLKAKCKTVAHALDVELKSSVVMLNHTLQENVFPHLNPGKETKKEPQEDSIFNIIKLKQSLSNITLPKWTRRWVSRMEILQKRAHFSIFITSGVILLAFLSVSSGYISLENLMGASKETMPAETPKIPSNGVVIGGAGFIAIFAFLWVRIENLKNDYESVSKDIGEIKDNIKKMRNEVEENVREIKIDVEKETAEIKNEIKRSS
ncbi:DUF89 family protein [archaeon]|nr:DUF89 family protein [archaeon]